MLHILLLILKIIGIILLVVIGLILLIVCSVIFVPVRYYFDTSYYEKPKIFARVSWLFSFICVKLSYEDDFHMRIQLFGMTIIDNKKPKKKKAAKVKKTKSVVSKTPDKHEKLPEPKEITDDCNGAEASVDAKIIIEEKNTENSQKNVSQTPKKVYDKFIEKINAIVKKIVSIFENIQSKIDNIIIKLSTINEKKEAILAILFADANRAAFIKVKRVLLRMFGSLLPRKIKAEIAFGFEDPATTGFLLGIAGMMYPIYFRSVCLHPDFQNKIFEGWIKGRGRIQVFAFIKAAVLLILDKRIRNIIIDFKKVF